MHYAVYYRDLSIRHRVESLVRNNSFEISLTSCESLFYYIFTLYILFIIKIILLIFLSLYLCLGKSPFAHRGHDKRDVRGL